jgi:hypothetical protein
MRFKMRLLGLRVGPLSVITPLMLKCVMALKPSIAKHLVICETFYLTVIGARRVSDSVVLVVSLFVV